MERVVHSYVARNGRLPVEESSFTTAVDEFNNTQQEEMEMLFESKRESFWEKFALSILGGEKKIDDTYNFLCILNENKKTSKDIVDEFVKQRVYIPMLGGKPKVYTKGDNENKIKSEGVSFLHLAAIYLPDSTDGATIMKYIIKLQKASLFRSHDDTESYDGQTPLHIAIAKGNIAITNEILNTFKKSRKTFQKRKSLFNTVVTSPLFTGTPQMGQTPLNTAALTLNTKMVNLLLSQGALLTQQNMKGETVFHSLVEYASCKPEHTEKVIVMIEHIVDIMQKACDDVLTTSEEDGSQDDYLTRAIEMLENFSVEKHMLKSVLMIENKKKETALRLAARRGQRMIFECILKIPGVYKEKLSHDGVFDICFYDVTEIDKVAMTSWLRAASLDDDSDVNQQSKDDFCNCYPLRQWWRKIELNTCQSALEYICVLPLNNAIEMTNVHVLKQMISTKWSRYRWFYLFFGIFHALVMSLLTASAVMKEHNAEYLLLEIVRGLSFVLSILYLLQELVRYLIAKQPLCVRALHHNGPGRMTFVFFAVFLFLDACWNAAAPWNNFFMVPTLWFGWWAMTFFLRGIRMFSFFTVFIYRVIVGDFLRFFIFMLIQIISFSALLMIAMSTSAPEFQSFGSTMLTLMVLVLDPGNVSQHSADAAMPGLAIPLFSLYLALTYLILLNALIGMISTTCSELTTDLKGQVQLQRLSVAIFIEGMIPRSMKTKCKVEVEQELYRFINETMKETREIRFMRKIYSVSSPDDFSSNDSAAPQ